MECPNPEDHNEASALRNLLAIIHRDGGHYTTEHGLAKAVEDAHQVWADLQLKADDVDALRAALTEAQVLLERIEESQKDNETLFGAALRRAELARQALAALHTPTGAGTCPEVYRDLHYFERCDLQAGHQGPHSFTTPTAEAN